MSDLDADIRQALEAEEQQFVDDDDALQVAHMEGLKVMFRGQTKWFTAFHLLVMGGLITMIVVCGMQFFDAESTRGMIGWATGFGVFITLQAISELFFMIELNKYLLRREVKHLEFQVATLSQLIRSKFDGDQDPTAAC